MRVLLVVPAFPRLSETFIANKFAGLVDRGMDVHVWCARSEASEWAKFPRLAARADLRARVHVSAPAERHVRTLRDAPRVLARDLARAPLAAARFVRRGGRAQGWKVLRRLYGDTPAVALAPDILHFEFGSLAVERAYLKRALGCKMVASFRGTDICYSGLDKPGYYDEVWREVTALHFLGRDLRARALARGCPPERPFRLIAPAIDVDAFAGLAAPATEPVGTAARPVRLLSVARLEWKKGHEWLLAAVARMKESGLHVRLRVVGGGAFAKTLHFLRHQLGLEAEVELEGSVAPEAVRERLAWADVFVHAAVSEGFCNAVVEAQAAGLPVVTSDAEGLAENVADGETGFVVPRRDPEAMAARVAELAAAPALRERFARAGRARAEQMFRLAPQLDAWVDFYREVALAS